MVSGASLVAFGAKVVLGVALLVAWAVLGGREQAQTVKRSSFFVSSSVVMSVAFLAALVALNYIVVKKNKTWDLTTKKIFSLSDQTKRVLGDLKEPIKVVTFIPDFKTKPPPLEDLFGRYAAISDKFSWEYKDPLQEPEATKLYGVKQDQPASYVVKGEGKAQVRLGINVQKVATPALAEQELTNAIAKITRTRETGVYFVTGHGELPLDSQAGANLKRALSEEGYNPQSVNILQRGEVPLDAALLVIAGPKQPLTEREAYLIDQFLEAGGRLLYFAEGGAEMGLDAVLAKYGIQIDHGLVADTRQQPETPFTIVTATYGEHETVRPLATAATMTVFDTVRSLTVLRQGMLAGVSPVPLVLTAPSAFVKRDPSDPPADITGEKAGQMPLAVASMHDTKSAANRRSEEARVLVVGDADCLGRAFSYDRDLVLNFFAWATQQGLKITIRPPDRDISTLDVSPEKFTSLRLMALDALPLSLLAVGLTIWLTRRNR
jgi:ABC-type uncharacterized transport system involved in gliding motility auxiliary subunit